MTSQIVVPPHLRRFPGSPEQLDAAAHRLSGIASALEVVSKKNQHLSSHVDGGVWVGKGATAARQVVTSLGNDAWHAAAGVGEYAVRLKKAATIIDDGATEVRRLVAQADHLLATSPHNVSAINRLIDAADLAYNNTDQAAAGALAGEDLSALIPSPTAQLIGAPTTPVGMDPVLALGALGVRFHANGVPLSLALPGELVVSSILGALSPSEKARLLHQGATIDLVPIGGAVTDTAQFAYLKGQNTFDGRPWTTVDGVDSGIHEAYSPSDPRYGPGFTAAHETGHLVESALSANQTTQLQSLWQSRVNSNGPWLNSTTPSGGPYDASNRHEYFADSTAAFFNHQYYPGDATFSPQWLKSNDPSMYAFLQSVYPGRNP